MSFTNSKEDGLRWTGTRLIPERCFSLTFWFWASGSLGPRATHPWNHRGDASSQSRRVTCLIATDPSERLLENPMLFGLPDYIPNAVDSLFFSVWLTENTSHPFFMLLP